MSDTEHRASPARLFLRASVGLMLLASVAHAQVPPPHPNAPKANWVLFNQFGSAGMRNLSFSTSITPRWIGESDSLFYSWRDRTGNTGTSSMPRRV